MFGLTASSDGVQDAFSESSRFSRQLVHSPYLCCKLRVWWPTQAIQKCSDNIPPSNIYANDRIRIRIRIRIRMYS